MCLPSLEFSTITLETRRACEPRADVLEKLEMVAAIHAKLPDPRGV